MIIIASIISLFFIVVIVMLLRAYTKDIKELEDRVLIVEKRQVDFERSIKKDYKGIYIPIDEEVKLLIPLIEKDKLDIDAIKKAYSIMNNREEGEKMPCGRRGRPVGRRTTSRGKGKRK